MEGLDRSPFIGMGWISACFQTEGSVQDVRIKQKSQLWSQLIRKLSEKPRFRGLAKFEITEDPANLTI